MVARDYPHPETLLPHGPPAVLLGEVVSHDPEATVCRARVLPGNPYLDSGGGVPAAYAVEYMSQCAAVHGALAGGGAGAEGAPPAKGFLAGVRSLTLAARRFPVGQRLLVEARALGSTSGTGSAGGAAIFACTLRSDDSEDGNDNGTGSGGSSVAGVLAEGRLTIWIPDNGGEAP